MGRFKNPMNRQKKSNNKRNNRKKNPKPKKFINLSDGIAQVLYKVLYKINGWPWAKTYSLDFSFKFQRQRQKFFTSIQEGKTKEKCTKLESLLFLYAI